MQSRLIEPEPESRLILVPAPGESLGGPEFQSDLNAFAQALGTQGIKAQARSRARDAVAGGGGSAGEYVLLSTLGSVAIVQLRKLVVAFLKIREGRKLKLRPGTIEGHVDDIEKILTQEQISKLLGPPKKPRTKG
jgi:hypothetical protein